MSDKKVQKQGGFTLAELLVIVAIIGVLVAVSIPIFTSQLEKARAATCIANRRSLKSVIAMTLMTDSENELVKKDNPLQTQKSFSLTSEQEKQFTCPKHGVLSYSIDFDKNSITVFCSVHDPGGLTTASFQKIYDLLTDNTLWTTMDSGATDGTNTSKTKFLKALEGTGLNFTNLGVQSWRVSGTATNNGMIEWTTQDISKLKPGDQIVIMRCRFNYEGQPFVYTVWNATVTEHKEADSDSYNIINTGATQLTKNTDNKLDLEAIKKVYNDNRGDAPAMN